MPNLPSLPNALVQDILQRLPRNTYRASVPLLNKEFRDQCSGIDKTIHMGDGEVPPWFVLKELERHRDQLDDKNTTPYPLIHKVQKWFIETGSLEAWKASVARFPVLRPHHFKLRDVMVRDDANMFEWVVDQCSLDLSVQMTIDAAQHGSLHVLKCLQRRGCPWNSHRITMAAMSHGRLHVLQWITAHFRPLQKLDMWFAAGQAHVCVLEWALQSFPDISVLEPQTMLRIAVLHDRMQVVEWLVITQRYCYWEPDLYTLAIENNCVNVVFWAIENELPSDGMLCKSAASRPDLALLELARAHGHSWDEDVCAKLAQNRQLAGLQWAFSNGCPWDSRVCMEAASHSDMLMLVWAHEHGCPLDASVFTAVAKYGVMPVMEWLHNQGCPWDENTSATAADNRRGSLLKWLHERSCPWDARVYVAAAARGDIELLKWIREQENCPEWDERTCNAAAHQGQLKTLKWLRSNGCPWSEETFAEAADGNRMATMIWMRSNGCPWDARTFAKAVNRFSSWRTLTWLLKHGCPWDANTFATAVTAGPGDQSNTLQWLRDNGCPWDASAYIAAAREGRMEDMIWLQENGCPLNMDDMNAAFTVAVEKGRLHIVAWLIERGCRASDHAIKLALSTKSYFVANWLMTVHGMEDA